MSESDFLRRRRIGRAYIYFDDGRAYMTVWACDGRIYREDECAARNWRSLFADAVFAVQVVRDVHDTGHRFARSWGEVVDAA